VGGATGRYRPGLGPPEFRKKKPGLEGSTRLGTTQEEDRRSKHTHNPGPSHHPNPENGKVSLTRCVAKPKPWRSATWGKKKTTNKTTNRGDPHRGPIWKQRPPTPRMRPTIGGTINRKGPGANSSLPLALQRETRTDHPTNQKKTILQTQGTPKQRGNGPNRVDGRGGKQKKNPQTERGERGLAKERHPNARWGRAPSRAILTGAQVAKGGPHYRCPTQAAHTPLAFSPEKEASSEPGSQKKKTGPSRKG